LTPEHPFAHNGHMLKSCQEKKKRHEKTDGAIFYGHLYKSGFSLFIK